MHQFNVEGANFLITGATGHLGSVVAMDLCKLGALVFINGRDTEKVSKLVDYGVTSGWKVRPAVFDVTNFSDVKNFFACVDAPINYIINFAYSGGSGRLKTASNRQFYESYKSCVIGAKNLIQAGIPHLKASVTSYGDAAITNIASMYGSTVPFKSVYEPGQDPNPPFYGAAKASLIHFTKYAAVELAADRIRVNTISPGPFPNPSTQQERKEFIRNLEERVPLGRIGNPTDLTGAVTFINSKAALFVTGINLPVDGGWTCL